MRIQRCNLKGKFKKRTLKRKRNVKKSAPDAMLHMTSELGLGVLPPGVGTRVGDFDALPAYLFPPWSFDYLSPLPLFFSS